MVVQKNNNNYKKIYRNKLQIDNMSVFESLVPSCSIVTINQQMGMTSFIPFEFRLLHSKVSTS